MFAIFLGLGGSKLGYFGVLGIAGLIGYGTETLTGQPTKR